MVMKDESDIALSFLVFSLVFMLQCACYMNSYTYVCVLEIKKKKKKKKAHSGSDSQCFIV